MREAPEAGSEHQSSVALVPETDSGAARTIGPASLVCRVCYGLRIMPAACGHAG